MNNNVLGGDLSDNNQAFNAQMMSMLATDMHDILSRYILDCLMWNIKNSSQPQTKDMYIRSEFLGTKLTLKELALQKRSHVIAPIPIYPSSEESSIKDDNRDRSESFSTARDENTLANTVKGGLVSPKKLSDLDESPKRAAKAARKSKEELKKIKMELAFDNETGELATRCDVVYKTILRDCRRFFLDNFKLFKQKNSNGSDMSDNLFRFIMGLFPNKSVRACKSLSIDLGCLLFPKEMTKDSIFLSEIVKTDHFGKDVSSFDEIMRIHGFLYKFSIDKIQECFENNSLCQLFLYYVKETRDDRISENPTMNRNASIYIKARNILEEKALASLSQ